MLNEFLQKLEFTDKEIAVYLCIQENGKLSAADVSRITKVNRTTVYSVSKELVKKGIIQEDISGTTTYYTALPPEDLRTLYVSEEKELEEKKTAIEKAILELQALPKSKNYSVPKIRFIEEDKLEDHLFKQTPVWFESAVRNGELSWWGFEDSSWINLYPEWIKFHWETAPKNLGAHLITDDHDFKNASDNKNVNPLRQIKLIDAKQGQFTANQAVLGDYVVFIMTKQKPYYMIEIHDSVMAHNLRETFKLLWDKI